MNINDGNNNELLELLEGDDLFDDFSDAEDYTGIGYPMETYPAYPYYSDPYSYYTATGYPTFDPRLMQNFGTMNMYDNMNQNNSTSNHKPSKQSTNIDEKINVGEIKQLNSRTIIAQPIVKEEEEKNNPIILQTIDVINNPTSSGNIVTIKDISNCENAHNDSNILINALEEPTTKKSRLNVDSLYDGNTLATTTFISPKVVSEIDSNATNSKPIKVSSKISENSYTPSKMKPPLSVVSPFVPSEDVYEKEIRFIKPDNSDPQNVEKARKNAIQARINRQKKKQEMGVLQDKLQGVEEINERLKIENTNLEKEKQYLLDEVAYLKNVIINQSTLSKLIKDIDSSVDNVRLSSSFHARNICINHENPNGHSDKCCLQNIVPSSGVCLHVNQNKVTLEFCADCAKMASGSCYK